MLPEELIEMNKEKHGQCYLYKTQDATEIK